MKRSSIIFLIVIFSQTATIYSQDLDSIKGGYSQCHIYKYSYIAGVMNLFSRKEIKSYTYNSAGRMTEKQCILEPCSNIFEGTYFENIIKIKYVYDVSGNITKEQYFNRWGSCIAAIERTFDIQNNWTEEKLYLNKDIYVTTQRKYNEDNHVTEEVKYKDGGYVKMKWVYDSIGNNTEQMRINSANQDTFKCSMKYDDHGNRIAFTSNAAYGAISYTYYEYDKDGRVLVVAASGESDYTKQSFKYDSLGREIEHESYYQNLYHTSVTKTLYAADGSKTEVTDNGSWYPAIDSLKYNSNNFLTELSSYTRDGVRISKTLYSYDAYGNPLDIITYEQSDVPVSGITYVYSKQ